MSDPAIPDCTCPEIDCVHDQLLAAHNKIAEQEERIVLLTRLYKGKYLHWQEASGPSQCIHGVAAGIACRPCDVIALNKMGPL